MIGKIALYLKQSSEWLEKKVRNPETGNMVLVKSLSPTERKKYKPENDVTHVLKNTYTKTSIPKINEHANASNVKIKKIKPLSGAKTNKTVDVEVHGHPNDLRDFHSRMVSGDPYTHNSVKKTVWKPQIDKFISENVKRLN